MESEREKRKERKGTSKQPLFVFIPAGSLSRNRCEEEKIDGNEEDVKNSKSAPVGPLMRHQAPAFRAPLSTLSMHLDVRHAETIVRERKRLTTRPGTAHKKTDNQK